MDLKRFTDLTEAPEHKRPKLFGKLVPVNSLIKPLKRVIKNNKMK